MINWLYPRRCPVCKDIVMPRGELICEACEPKFRLIQEPKCMKCGRPLFDSEREYCSNCTKNRYHFQQGVSLWVYDDVMRSSISDYKFHNRRENADYYIKCMVNRYAKQLERWQPDALVPVPIHKSKRRYRGYNQADILAKGIGRALNIPVCTNLIIRDKMTLPQKTLTGMERLKNLEHAFSFNKDYKDHSKFLKNIVLVDDIYTTGSTIEACTRACIAGGIEQVYFMCLSAGYNYTS